MTKKLSVKERVRRAKQSGQTLLNTRTIDVWLGADVNLLDAYSEAMAASQADAGESPRGRRLDSASGRAEAARRVEELRAQLEEFRVPWKVRALSDREWERVLAANPPRKDGDAVHPDDAAGWNSRTMGKALVRAGSVEHGLDEDDWAFLLGDETTDGQMPPGEIDKISAAVFRLTRRPVDVNF